MDRTPNINEFGLPNFRRAIAYIRVSTRGQAERDGRREGLSIPAQRQAIRWKAGELGAFVAKEFVDRGQTGTNVDRPELHAKLEYLRDNAGVAFVIDPKLVRACWIRSGLPRP